MITGDDVQQLTDILADASRTTEDRGRLMSLRRPAAAA